MGIVAFWGMAALWGYRVTQPLGQASQSPSERSDPVRALQLGVQRDLQLAQTALQNGNQTELVRALDGARRVARVGRYAADPLFAKPLNGIERARRAIQDDDQTKAARAIEEALGAVAAESPTGAGTLAARPLRRTLEKYKGAVVLDALGDRIGRVDSVSGDAVVVVLGGKQDVFGFINIGGTKVTLPVRTLVMGEARTLGPTMVALPR